MRYSEMERPTCKTCPYFHEDPENDGVLDDGICRRHAPIPGFTEDRSVFDDNSAYPVLPRMLIKEWCGEHPDFPAYMASRTEP